MSKRALPDGWKRPLCFRQSTPLRVSGAGLPARPARQAMPFRHHGGFKPACRRHGCAIATIPAAGGPPPKYRGALVRCYTSQRTSPPRFPQGRAVPALSNRNSPPRQLLTGRTKPSRAHPLHQTRQPPPSNHPRYNPAHPSKRRTDAGALENANNANSKQAQQPPHSIRPTGRHHHPDGNPHNALRHTRLCLLPTGTSRPRLRHRSARRRANFPSGMAKIRGQPSKPDSAGEGPLRRSPRPLLPQPTPHRNKTAPRQATRPILHQHDPTR